ncbi:MAG: serine/threonine protein kinase, partial [Gammaproteobacteria bacterium]
LGSPTYMSPEQVRGRPVDGRGDLFALAVILYQMICGRRPFAGEDLTALAYAVVHESPPPIGRHVPGLPDALDRFFERALAKDPGARYPSGDSFRRALLEAVGDVAAADARRRPDLGPEATPPPRAAESTIVLEESSPPCPSELWVAAGSLLRRSARPLDSALGVVWRAPRRLRVALVATVVLFAAMSGWWAWAATRASLVLEARSSIEAGRLTLLVDGQEVYRRDLAAERKAATAFGKKMFEYGQERFEARIRVSPGKHDVIARVETDEASEPLTDRTVVDLERGESRTLRLVAGRALGAPLTLTSR